MINSSLIRKPVTEFTGRGKSKGKARLHAILENDFSMVCKSWASIIILPTHPNPHLPAPAKEKRWLVIHTGLLEH